MSRNLRTWDALVAQFTPEQIDAVDAAVASAGELTGEQIHTLRPLFNGAGERVAANRAAGPERGAA
jgi:hypothetical protein